MRHLLLTISIFNFSCSTLTPEQQLVDAFNMDKEYSGIEATSVIELSNQIENYLLNEGYLNSTTQDEYYQLTTKIIVDELKISEKEINRQIPNSWAITSPSATAFILKYPNKIIDENSHMDSKHPIRILTDVTNKIAETGDLGNIELIEKLIYSIPEKEFAKLHYRIVPIAIIRRGIEENAR